MFPNRVIQFDNWSLLPATWHGFAGDGPVWAFNPAILKSGGGWLFAYRIVLSDQRRRIAICRLDREFRVVSGSVVPLSDLITLNPLKACSEADRSWFADPRLYRFNGLPWIYWNSGWHNGPNAQFLHEIDSETLRPIGEPLLMERNGPRQMIEKNWMLFGSGGPVYAIYSPIEHSILKARIHSNSRELLFRQVCETAWDCQSYTNRFGSLRGGAPPVLRDASYYSVCHSVYGAPESYRYVASVYRFSAEAPFAVTHRPVSPLPLPAGSERINPILNPAIREVIYPAGAAWDDGSWVISYGVNDEQCRVAVLSDEVVEGCMCRLPGGE